MKICVLGLGYVGLPTAVVFAHRGLNVIGVDIDENKVELINKGKSYISEPELPEMLKKVVSQGLLSATSDGIEAVKRCDIVIVAVPTPSTKKSVDLSALKSALETIKEGLHREQLIVIESTIPPGTTVNLAKPFLEETGLYAEKDFYLAHVPERIAPGYAIKELLNAPRIVGGIGHKSTKKALEVYGKVNPNLLPTDATTAEFVKLIENTFRDLNIAYANFLALVAEKLGIDVDEAIRLANTHPRVNIHRPGAGVGGPCLTKDPYMLLQLSEDVFGAELIDIARKINEYMPKHTIAIILRALRGNNVPISKAKLAIFGAAYKGGIDDTRESPTKSIVSKLLNMTKDVVVYDPYTTESFGAQRANSIEDAIREADALVIVTDHPEFKQLDLKNLKKLMRHPIIVDGRRIIDPKNALKLGFKYYGIGFAKGEQ